MTTKAEIRLAIKERLKKLSPKDRIIESRVLIKQLKKILGTAPRTIGIYHPFIDEPDIRLLITELIRLGWTVCIPSVPSTGKSPMVFKKIKALSDVRKDPATGIPKPFSGTGMEEDNIAAVIIPGRAFTPNRDRMGRGSGGYDHWINLQRKRNPATRYVGVCFECQILSEIPVEPHDEKMDMVVTCRRIFQ